ncbi:hypothetical protein BDZ97DRAFT_1762326 [Flammula alnicola]|nr:hypothetical protein BDZ97DRAFT_1762326 [Flammula alnicola]
MATLGVDVLINIMTFLRPPDITCKALYIACLHRIVWLNALEQMMEEHCIPKATFPTASMDNHALEHAALSPVKFSTLVKDSYDEDISPRSFRLLSNSLTREEKAIHSIKSAKSYTDILLTPGGRFLITSMQVTVVGSQESTSYLQLWDLGLPGRKDKAKVVASSIIAKKMVHLRQLSPTPDGSGFYLVSSHEIAPFSILVHKITAFEPVPKITRVNKWKIPAPLVSLAISDSRLAVLYSPSTIMVWDFESNLSATWDGHVELDGESPLPIHLYNDNIILYHSGKLSMWKVQELLPGERGTSAQHQCLFTFTELFGKEHPGNEIDYENDYLLPYSPWTCNSHQPKFLGINTASKFALYHLQNLTNIAAAHVPNILPTHIATVHDLGEDTMLASALQFCNGNLLYTAINDEGDTVFLCGVSNPLVQCQTVEALPTKCLAVPHHANAITNVQLCAATGRMCVLSGEEDIYVMDYLHPPPRKHDCPSLHQK